MMHGKLPAHTITASLDTFSEVRREEGGKKKVGMESRQGGWETKARELE